VLIVALAACSSLFHFSATELEEGVIENGTPKKVVGWLKAEREAECE